MKTFKFSFQGRQRGAIGIFYSINDTYQAENINQALFMLYTDYECISCLKCNGKYVSNPVLEECEVFKRERNAKGTYLPIKYKSPECSKVLQFMDADYTYQEALHIVLKEFNHVNQEQLEKELTYYI